MSSADHATPLSHATRQITIGLALVTLFVLSSLGSQVSISRLLDVDGLSQAIALFDGLWHPDLGAEFLQRIVELTLESLAIGALGMALALVMAIVLAMLAARVPGLRHPPGHWPYSTAARGLLRWGARSLLSGLRSVPEIIWAFLFVRIWGLGPGAAVFAIGLSFAGIIGKLFAELIDASDPLPVRVLQAAGASRVSILLHGVLPQVREQWTGYAHFRFECAIRSAAVLGVVGAGGLGSEIELSIRYFQYDKLSTALLAVLACVAIMELASTYLRGSQTRWSVALLGAATIAGLTRLDVAWSELWTSEALDQFVAFGRGFLPPSSSSEMLTKATSLMVETVAIAAFGTLVAAVGAVLLAPLASRVLTIRGFMRDPPDGSTPLRAVARRVVLLGTRTLLQVFRSVPDLVWALMFVVWVGPGPFAGALAIGAHTLGILGRLFGEVYEDCEAEAPRVLEASGCTPLSNWLHAVLPQTAPQLAAFTLFRFEVNVRATAMVGFVGAGGIGDAIHTAISLFHMSDLATLLLVMFATVVLIDWLGDRLRSRLVQE
jgi:phosphonate transport system permease protein